MMMMACKRLGKLKCLIAFSWLLLKILRGLAGGGKAGKGEVSETCEEHQDSLHETHTKKNERRAHTGDQWEPQKRIESYYQLLSYLFLCFYIFHCSSSTKIAQFCEWMAWVHKRRYNLNHLPQKRSPLCSVLSNSINFDHTKGSHSLHRIILKTPISTLYRASIDRVQKHSLLLIEFNWFLSDIPFCYRLMCSFFSLVLKWNRRCDHFDIFHFLSLWAESKYKLFIIWKRSSSECVQATHNVRPKLIK